MDTQKHSDAVVAIRYIGGHALLQGKGGREREVGIGMIEKESYHN